MLKDGTQSHLSLRQEVKDIKKEESGRDNINPIILKERNMNEN